MSHRTVQRHTPIKPIELSIRSMGAELAAPALPDKAAASAIKKIMLPTMEGISFEKVKHILYLEANGNYTTLHFTDGRQILVCRSLCDIEQRLPSSAFVRIHRSHTIHLAHVKKYVRGKGGHVVMEKGVILAVSSGQKDHFLKELEQYFA